MKNTIDVDKISSASERIYNITKQLCKIYDDIDYSKERIVKIIKTFKDYNGYYASKKIKDDSTGEMVFMRSTWIISVKNNKTLYDKRNKANIALLNKEGLNLDQIANDLALAIREVENKLGVDAAKYYLYRSNGSDEYNIYTSESDYYNQFGGNQGELLDNEKFLKDPKIREIINKYFPNGNLSEEDLQLLFSRINNTGCGYVAACNTIYDYAKKLSSSEFKKKFGFEPYVIKVDKNGKKYKDYNYEYMCLDLFLYTAKNKKKYKNIKEVYGNEKDNPENKDGALSTNNNFEIIGMKSTKLDEVADATKDYLSDKGIELKTYGTKKEGMSGTWLDPNSKTYEKDKETLKKYGFSVDEDKYEGYVSTSGSAIKKSLDDNKKVVVSSDDFPLYYDKDGDGKYNDVVEGYENVGGHAMTVVNATDDKLLVSSWGGAYAIKVKDVKDFVIYDYGQ